MQVVRNGEIDDVDARVVEETAVVVGDGRDPGLPPPLLDGGRGVGQRDHLRACRVVEQRVPPTGEGQQLPAHQAAADDPDPDGRAHLPPTIAAAASTDAPSWSMAIKARVRPAGSACWITLRP